METEYEVPSEKDDIRNRCREEERYVIYRPREREREEGFDEQFLHCLDQMCT